MIRTNLLSWGVVLTLLAASAWGADNTSALPEPLTLNHALSLVDETHPELEHYRARIEAAEAQQQIVQAVTGTKVALEARLQAIRPSYRSLSHDNNDSSLKLKLHKQLYDFGRTQSALNAANHEMQGREWDYLNARQQRYLAIMASYFDVLLADLEYIRDNEVMTMAFLHWDKLKERGALGQVSDIDLLEKESLFQRARRELQMSENLQRASRSRLANNLNRPGQLSSDLEIPKLANLKRKPQDLEPLTQLVLQKNPALNALREKLRAADEEVRSAKAGGKPVIHGELEAATYNRVTGSRHPLAASLVVEIPFSTGGAVDAAVARQRALVHQQRAALNKAEFEMRQAVLELWLEINALKLEIGEVEAVGAYRELYLDRSRALYEQEVKSDLGDAQSRISDFHLLKAKVEYRLALAWVRLDALSGQLVDTIDSGE